MWPFPGSWGSDSCGLQPRHGSVFGKVGPCDSAASGCGGLAVSTSPQQQLLGRRVHDGIQCLGV